jgi:predicted O-methyltransferase YrrM
MTYSLPLIHFQFYEALSRLCGRYPERLLLRFSNVVGRPKTRRTVKESRYWRMFAPFRTQASVCDPTAIQLWRSLVRTRPSVIVEFGTGFSTFVLAAFAQWIVDYGGQRPSIVSIEHNAHWFRKQQDLLDKSGLHDAVSLRCSTTEKRDYFGRQVMCYGAIESVLADLNLKDGVDFVFVDGPPATVYGSVGRRGSILQAISICKQGGTILIHDALRFEEYGAIREYHRNTAVPFRCHGILPVWYGLAICEKVRKP